MSGARDKRPARRKRRPKRGGRRGRGGWWLVTATIVAVLTLPPLALLGWGTLPGPGSGGVVEVTWRPTDSAREAAEQIAAQGLIGSPRLLAAYLWLTGGLSAVHAGSHLVSDSASPSQLMRQLVRSQLRRRVTVTVPEGWNHLQIARRLHQAGVCSEPSFRAATHSRALLRELGIAGASAEGYLFPATYDLALNSAAREVVRRLVGETRGRLARLAKAQPGAMKRLREQHQWGERELLIMASIVEKEARHDSDRALIASVYFNRLTDTAFVPARRLQADPTAAYGCLMAGDLAPSCQGFRGEVTPAMVRDSGNPYNTYRHEGLPPGPIANPGEASLRATLEPAESDYLFFVAKRDGHHRFSRTYEEHRRAVQGGR